LTTRVLDPEYHPTSGKNRGGFEGVTGRVWALLRPSKTGNNFLVFYMEKICLIFDIIDADDTTNILDKTESGVIFGAWRTSLWGNFWWSLQWTASLFLQGSARRFDKRDYQSLGGTTPISLFW
jgi:hypothetical protein